MNAKQPPAPPMTLGNMRSLGVRGLAIHCLAGRHLAVIGVEDFGDDVEVPSFGRRLKCTKCGDRNVDVRPNWLEQPPAESLTGKQWR